MTRSAEAEDEVSPSESHVAWKRTMAPIWTIFSPRTLSPLSSAALLPLPIARAAMVTVFFDIISSLLGAARERGC